MSKADAILKQLQHIDTYIDSLVRRRNKIQASLLSSQQFDKEHVSGGQPMRQDDIYVELIATKEELEAKGAEAIRLKRDLEGYIDRVEDFRSRHILTLVYIEHMDRFDVCEELQCDMSTLYRRLSRAKKHLANVCE